MLPRQLLIISVSENASFVVAVHNAIHTYIITVSARPALNSSELVGGQGQFGLHASFTYYSQVIYLLFMLENVPIGRFV